MLKNIELSSDDLTKLLLYSSISCGSEGIILDAGKNIAYKIFGDFLSNDKVTSMSDNKFSKIKKLYELDLDSLVKIYSTISMNGELIGYSMSYDKKDFTFNDIHYPNEYIIFVLKKLKEILLELARNDIVYGDVHDQNILINHRKKSVKMCDIDNMMVAGFPMDLKGSTINNYIKDRDNMVDSTLDAYMYNILSFTKVNFPNRGYVNKKELLELIKNNIDGIVYEFCVKAKDIDDCKRVKGVCKKMLVPSSFDGEYVLK